MSKKFWVIITFEFTVGNQLPNFSADPRLNPRLNQGKIAPCAGYISNSASEAPLPKERVTRGSGLLETFLARRRAEMANRLIPSISRAGCIADIGCGRHPYFLLNTIFSRKIGLDKSI